MATAYNVLANGGLKVEPVTVLQVTDEKGKTLEQHQAPPPARVVHEESAFLVTNMLRSVLNEGTAAAARGMGFTRGRGGQDGNDQRPARRLVRGLHARPAVRRVGGLTTTTRPSTSPGRKAALPIWVDFMKAALAGTKQPSLRACPPRTCLRRHRQADRPARQPRLPEADLRGLHRRHRAPGTLPAALRLSGQSGATRTPCARLTARGRGGRRRSRP